MNIRIGLAGLVLAFCLWSTVASAADSLKARTSGTNWKFAVRVAGAWDGEPWTDEEVLRSGTGYNLELLIPLSHRFAIVANYGRSGLRAVELPQWPRDDYESYASTFEYALHRYSIGLRYTHFRLFGWKKTNLYIDLTGGKFHRDVSGFVLLRDIDGRPGYRWHINTVDPELLIEMELGLQKQVTSRLLFELGFRRYLSFTSDESANGETTITMDQTLGVCLGVTVGFGRKN